MTSHQNPVRAVFEKNWDNAFITDAVNGNTLTYSEFFAIALACKRALEQHGLHNGEKICMLLPNSLESIALYFAAMLSNSVAVPLDTNRGEVELSEIIAQAEPALAVCEDNRAALFKKRAGGIITLAELRKAISKPGKVEKEELAAIDNIKLDDLFLITFTSGSTGEPKGVKHSLSNLIESALAFGRRFNFSGINTFYHNLPMVYMGGILNLIILPFMFGCRIIVGERFSASAALKFWDIPIKHKANVFWFPPTALALLLEIDRGTKGIDYCRANKITCITAFAPLSNKLKDDFERKYGTTLYESYGLSETLFVSAASPDIKQPYRGVGRPLDGVKLGFMPDKEIAIDVPWIYLGYTNKPSDGFFSGSKYLSGDIGRLDAKGLLEITGRKKDIIKKGGMLISPKRIDDFIENSGMFKEFAVLGIEDKVLGEKIVCYYMPNKDFSGQALKQLNSKILDKLGKDYLIDEFVPLTSMPKTLSGKTDKHKLRQSSGAKK